MTGLTSSAERIVIVGGGFAGLSAAARLAQAGLPVTLFEASKLGHAASTQNQGWLHSGGWFARTHSELARMCHESLRQTLAFCPDCAEPDARTMIYFSQESASDLNEWTRAWETAGIPHEGLLSDELSRDLPGLSLEKVCWGMRLPDRSFRPDILLSKLAATARDAGAEIRPGTSVTGLISGEGVVQGVAIGTGEEVRGRMVILATGAYSQTAFSQLFSPVAGEQSDYQLVCLKTHLRAIRPCIAADPFCCVDGVGLNHLPHPESSVFGTGRWEIVTAGGNSHVEEKQVADIERALTRLFPSGFGGHKEARDWAGTTVQAMHVEQVHPGDAPLPTIVDHSREPSGLENVISIFPGRATLWAQLAERVRTMVLEKVGTTTTESSHPPWNVTN